jgi:hypothetical protein
MLFNNLHIFEQKDIRFEDSIDIIFFIMLRYMEYYLKSKATLLGISYTTNLSSVTLLI